MAEKQSTFLCNYLLQTGGLRQVFNAANLTELRIYSGTPPATADAAITGVKIAVVRGPAAAYLSFAATAAAGVLAKEAAAWADPSAVGGVASHYRLVQNGDPDTADAGPTYARIQGTVGVGGSDMNVGTTTIGAAAVFTVNTFTQSEVPS